MDFMKLFGTVVAVLFHPGSSSKLNGQRICRRGTERPCYMVSYIQDSRQRLTFEDARKACRLEGGELLSIETESEQRLIERVIRQLQAGDGDFWIGLRRGPERYMPWTSPACPSQYYWLDGSKAKFRNWHWDEPSCGGEMCVVLYYQPSIPQDEDGHFLFRWNDHNCESKNNFVCKYREVKVPLFSEEGDAANADLSWSVCMLTISPLHYGIYRGLGSQNLSLFIIPSLRPSTFSTTERVERLKIGQTETVSLSENTQYVSYILYATIPALVLLLFAAAGFFCYKRHAKRRKTQTHSDAGISKPHMETAVSPYAVHGPYAFSDITKLDNNIPADIMTTHPSVPSQRPQCDDYENVSCMDRESCFVTNDIYETSKPQSQCCHSQSGWVENEIYG